MCNTNITRTILLLLSASRIISSTIVPDDYSQELLISGITYNCPVPEDLTTELQNPLVCETSEQWAECVSFLETHFDKDSREYKQLQDIKDHTSLSLPVAAVIWGYTELIQALLRYGVPVNQKYGPFEETMLHLAAVEANDNLVCILLTHGANIQVKDCVGNTPLHTAVNFKSTTVKLLLDSGADVNFTNDRGETPLFQAVHFFAGSELIHVDISSEELTEYIINESFVTCVKNIKLLLEHGADTNIPNNLRITPLHIAAKDGNLTIVQLLIDGGANINTSDDNNQTPLHVATESNNFSVVEYLVAMGCDKTITDSKNKTALDIAEEKNFAEIVDLLSKES